MGRGEFTKLEAMYIEKTHGTVLLLNDDASHESQQAINTRVLLIGDSYHRALRFVDPGLPA